jgi:hypothetical protein
MFFIFYDTRRWPKNLQEGISGIIFTFFKKYTGELPDGELIGW